jgi:hypothetical protein
MTRAWPPLPFESWRDTYATLHMWTQIVGKVCLALTPLSNHFWNIAFRVTSRGLATPQMRSGALTLAITFDFIDHQLVIQTSDGRVERLPLAPRTVAQFYADVMEALQRLGLRVRIWTMPVEIPDPADRIPFERDEVHRSYDPDAANAFWRVLLAIEPVFERFRGGFIGKGSPVHFFWGSFDLAVTRFSGERAPERDGADSITKEAYSHAVVSHGFWPGNGVVPMPVFYAYAAPEPEGFSSAKVQQAAAYYETTFKEYMLPYDAVRTAASPADELAAFLHSTYDAAADLAGWNRSELERR